MVESEQDGDRAKDDDVPEGECPICHAKIEPDRLDATTKGIVRLEKIEVTRKVARLQQANRTALEDIFAAVETLAGMDATPAGAKAREEIESHLRALSGAFDARQSAILRYFGMRETIEIAGTGSARARKEHLDVLAKLSQVKPIPVPGSELSTPEPAPGSGLG